MRATAVLPSCRAAAVIKAITHQGQQTTSVGCGLMPVTEEVQASRWLSDSMLVHGSAVGLLTISMESLILAQDERWRRA